MIVNIDVVSSDDPQSSLSMCKDSILPLTNIICFVLKCVLGRDFHTVIENVPFPSPTNEADVTKFVVLTIGNPRNKCHREIPIINYNDAKSWYIVFLVHKKKK